MTKPSLPSFRIPLIRPSGVFKNLPVESWALMVFGPSQFREVLSHNSVVPHSTYPLGFSSLRTVRRGASRFILAGPALGAPLAAMVMEVLVACGVQKVIGFGPCGSLSPRANIGDVLIPNQAFSDEGTSAHYPMSRRTCTASPALTQALEQTWTQHHAPYTRAKIWTTDAPFRETPEKIARFLTKGAIAVDMELSAFFRVGCFYGVETGAVLVVSDELFSSPWKPGYTDPVFKRSFRNATEIVCDFLCRGC